MEAPQTIPARVVVIGFGSPIRGDDALGPLVADQLAEEVAWPEVEVLSRHILTAELAERLRDASLVVFLDASVEGPLGEIVQQTVEPDVAGAIGMAHTVDPRGLLAWTRGLYGHAPHGVLLTARGATFDYAHYHLSPALAATVRPMIDAVKRLVTQHLRETDRGSTGG